MESDQRLLPALKKYFGFDSFKGNQEAIMTNLLALLSEELRKCAMALSSLKLRMASTWFFIKAISGEITMAVPSISSAGSW